MMGPLSIRTWEAPALPEMKPKPTPAPRSSGRRGSFAAAHMSRMVSFQQTLEAAHQEIQRDLTMLRAHSRSLAKDNVYARRYAHLVQTHVVGPDGITLESEILGNGKKPKAAWNDSIEQAWEEWGQAVSVDGRSSWIEFQQKVVSTCAVDGECLIRKVVGYPNKFRFALEIIDADRLDWTYNLPTDSQGNRTIMGIQMDQWGRRTGYWIWSAHPMDYQGAPRRVLVPASEILHIFDEDRVRGVRGIPWTTACMVQLNMLGRLWNAELSSAIFDASNLGVIKSKEGVLDSNGDPIETDPVGMADELDFEFASFLGLDPNLDIEFAPPHHPNSAIGQFSKDLLKGFASGVNVAYHSISGDVADANYTASRVASIDERDNWKKLQVWFIRQVCAPIFRSWLELAANSGSLTLPAVDVAKLYAPKWWARSWEWVDPEKEIKSSILAIRAGLSTYQAEAGALGMNWRKIMRQRLVEQEFQEELGLRLELDMGKGGTAAPSDPADLNDVNSPAPPAPAAKPKGDPNGK
jgi:lambda family phage portal protein